MLYRSGSKQGDFFDAFSLTSGSRRRPEGRTHEENEMLDCLGASRIEDLEGEKDLRLAGRALKLLPDSIGFLQSVLTLEVYDNQLEELPDSLCSLWQLKKAYFNNNRLLKLPDGFGKLQFLTHLRLDGNKLSVLPACIGDLSSLKWLEVQDNCLEALPDSFGNLVSLETLRAKNNRLTVLPSNFALLSSLQALVMSQNMLRELPENFGMLKSIEHIDLQCNKLKTLPESFGQLDKLRSLKLNNNPLASLPASVHSLGIKDFQVGIMKSLRLGLFRSSKNHGDAAHMGKAGEGTSELSPSISETSTCSGQSVHSGYENFTKGIMSRSGSRLSSGTCNSSVSKKQVRLADVAEEQHVPKIDFI